MIEPKGDGRFRITRIATWTPKNIDPRKPLTGLALKLMALGALVRTVQTRVRLAGRDR